jgi:hypothetical protein
MRLCTGQGVFDELCLADLGEPLEGWCGFKDGGAAEVGVIERDFRPTDPQSPTVWELRLQASQAICADHQVWRAPEDRPSERQFLGHDRSKPCPVADLHIVKGNRAAEPDLLELGVVAEGGAIERGVVAEPDLLELGVVAEGGALERGAVAEDGAIEQGEVVEGGAIERDVVAEGGAIERGVVAEGGASKPDVVAEVGASEVGFDKAAPVRPVLIGWRGAKNAVKQPSADRDAPRIDRSLLAKPFQLGIKILAVSVCEALAACL